jgi:hypothetical protein
VDDAEAARAFDAEGRRKTKQKSAAGDDAAATDASDAARDRKRATAAAARALGVRRHRTRAVEAEENGEDGITGQATELDPRTEKRLAKKKRVAYALLREREKRAARLQTMAAEMALRREISHARGHKRKVRAEEEEDTPEGLRHLKKAEPQFKWKKERKR